MVARLKAPPAAATEGIVQVQAELGEGPVGDGLHHAWQAGFGSGIQLAFAYSRVQEAVRAGFPCLRSVEHHDADAAHGAKVVQTAGQNVGVHRAAVDI